MNIKKTVISVLSAAIMTFAAVSVYADYSKNIGSDFESCTIGEKISATGFDVVEKNSGETSGNRSHIRCIEYNGGKAAEITTYKEDSSSASNTDGYFDVPDTSYSDITWISFDFEIKGSDYFKLCLRGGGSDKEVYFSNILVQSGSTLTFVNKKINITENTPYSVDIILDRTNNYGIMYLNDKMYEVQDISSLFYEAVDYSKDIRTRIQAQKTKLGVASLIVDNFYIRSTPILSTKTAEVSPQVGSIEIKDSLKEIEIELNDVPSRTEPTITFKKSDRTSVDINIKKKANGYCVCPDMDSIHAGEEYTLSVSNLKSYSADYEDVTYVYQTPELNLENPSVEITGIKEADREHIKVSASAKTTNAWGSITEVRFYVDGELYDTDKSEPYYAYIKRDDINQDATVYAVAYDNYGGSTQTSSSTLQVASEHLFKVGEVVIYSPQNKVSKKLEKGAKAECEIKNISKNAQNLMLIGAIYSDDKLVKTEIKNITVNEADTTKQTFEIDKDYGEDAKFSVFYWNEDDLTAHSDKYSANIYHEYSAEQIHERLLGRANIIGTDEDFQNIKSLYDNDERFTAFCNKVISQAQTYLAKEPPEYAKPDGLRLSSAYTTQDALENIAFAYKFTGDAVYAEGAKKYLDNAMAYTDWNNINHYLDTSALMHGFAIAYDWCRDYFEENYPGYLAELRAAVKKFGLDRAEELYTGTKYEWHRFTHNVNIVDNSGVIMAALICSEDESMREYSAQMLAYALQSISGALVAYSPDGAYAEGPGYWDYAGRNLASCASSLVATTGSDFGTIGYDGMDKTLMYAEAMTGSTGCGMNIHDGGNEMSRVNMPSISFFADYFDESAIKEKRIDSLAKYQMSIEPYELIWLSRPTTGDSEMVISGDQCFKSMNTASMCKDKADENSSYVMVHGGENSVPHGQLDIGNFIFESLGERWAIDLGKDDYNLDGYFETDKRFNYYRNRAEAHNTLVMNISSGNYYDQPYEAEGVITDFISEPDMAYTELDMTEAYPNYANSAIRYFKLDKVTGELTVTDKINFKSETELHWFMNTDAVVTLSEDKKSAVLTKNGRQLLVEIASEGTEIIELWEVKPHQASPDAEGQAVNTGVTKLTIANPSASGNYTLTVNLKPLI